MVQNRGKWPVHGHTYRKPGGGTTTAIRRCATQTFLTLFSGHGKQRNEMVCESHIPPFLASLALRSLGLAADGSLCIARLPFLRARHSIGVGDGVTCWSPHGPTQWSTGKFGEDRRPSPTTTASSASAFTDPNWSVTAATESCAFGNRTGHVRSGHDHTVIPGAARAGLHAVKAESLLRVERLPPPFASLQLI
jgi:hypothetical protein